jgi:hypothetical protein
MPILNLAQIASRATEMAGGRNDWSLSDASFWINVAFSEVFNHVGHQPLEALATSSTTSGENRIALPTDWNYGIALTLYQGSGNTSSPTTSVVRLQQQDPGWIDAQPLTPSGVPAAYITYATWVELWPSPNSAYSLQLRYAVKPQTLVASTDTPTLDERWHPAVLYKTVELLEASRNNVEGEAMARNRYLNHMLVTPTDQSLKHRDRGGMRLRYVTKFD